MILYYDGESEPKRG